MALGKWLHEILNEDKSESAKAKKNVQHQHIECGLQKKAKQTQKAKPALSLNLKRAPVLAHGCCRVSNVGLLAFVPQ